MSAVAQEVPWAEGRLALVSYEGSEWQVMEARLVPTKGTDLAPSPGAPRGTAMLWVSNERPDEWWKDEGVNGAVLTRLLPGQCRDCFEIGTHTVDCRVGDNLERGVPAFWAPWAHRVVPTPLPGHTLLTCHGPRPRRLLVLCRRPDDSTFWESGLGGELPLLPGATHFGYLVALGPDGAPTNEPWESR